MNRVHSVVFLIASKHCISDSLLTMRATAFLLCSLLPSPVWPLLIYLDSWTPHSRFLSNIVLYSIGLYFHHQSHPQLGVVFALASSLHSFWSYFSTLLRSILGTYWPGSTSFSIVSFFLFILFMGFSRQKYFSGLPFPSSVDHVLSELFTVTRPSWVALHSMAHGFIELAKAVIHVMSLVSFLWLWFLSVWPLMLSLRGLWELPDQRDWLQGNLGLVLMGRAMFSKSLIQ